MMGVGDQKPVHRGWSWGAEHIELEEGREAPSRGEGSSFMRGGKLLHEGLPRPQEGTWNLIPSRF